MKTNTGMKLKIEKKNSPTSPYPCSPDLLPGEKTKTNTETRTDVETKTKKKISTRLVEMRQGKDKGICLTKTETSKKTKKKTSTTSPTCSKEHYIN